MFITIVFFSVILGAIIGSFLNVVVYRTHKGLSLGGRSICTHCKKQIPTIYLIPVLGYLFSGRKCFSCHETISSRYIWGESILGIVFGTITAIIVTNYGTGTGMLVPLVYWLIMSSLLFLISYYDYLYQLILPVPLYSALCISIVYGLITGTSMLTMILGLGVVIPFIGMYLYSHGEWIGYGDLELMVLMGISFGFLRGFGSIILAFWIATILMILVGIYFIVTGRNIHSWDKLKKIKIPFAPFLCISFVLVGLFSLDIFTLFLSLTGSLLF